ncbi:beta-lactamase-like protein [Flagelloscypha sp. PMI_526]|nr:beta-lactamase-like protein [Flagelloscypha sp. PMI_526]
MASTKASTIGSIGVTFLGTASATPSRTRTHSSLALRLGGTVWIFDCGEATQNRLQQSIVKLGKIDKIFITHTHGDHIFGLVPLMASRLNGAGGITSEEGDPRANIDLTLPPLEIYGPLGTRAYVRNALKYTHSFLGGPYVVHELRFNEESIVGDYTELPLNRAELPSGRNISMNELGVWDHIFQDDLLTVSSAPIFHSCPCVGYVVSEKPLPGKIDPKIYVSHIRQNNAPMSVLRNLQNGEDVTLDDGTILSAPPRRPGRKVVILGDTFDPSPIASLADGADVIIHEATNAHLPHIPRYFKPGDTDTYDSVEERAKLHGHSTPQMAGLFAKRIGARKLILNHFSSRYPGDDDVNEESKEIMESIRRLAVETFEKDDVVCARDMMSIEIPLF